MRQFYLEYKSNEKLQQAAAEINWTSNTLIINRVKNEVAKEYYLNSVRGCGWTRNQF